MATQTDEILVKFRTEGGDEVTETFNRTSAAANNFHQGITKAGGALGDLRLKSEQRVANNIGAIAQALTSGGSAANVATVAFYKVAESFRGLLAFSAGASAAFVITEQLLKARDAADELHSSVTELTSFKGGAAFRPLEDIGAHFDALATKLKDLQGGQTGRIAGVSGAAFFQRIAQGGPFALPAASAAAGKAAGQEQNRIDQERADILGEQRDEVGRISERLSIVNSISRELLTGDEKSAALDQSKLQFLEDQDKLLSRFNVPGGEQQLAEAQTNLAAGRDTRDAGIIKRIDIQRGQYRTAASVVDVEKQLLPPAEENLKILDAKIAGVQELLKHQSLLSKNEVAELQIQKGQLEATKERAQFARQLEIDLSGLELGRVRGEVGSDRSKILGQQRLVDQAAAQGVNTPEFARAEAGLEDEQFRQLQQYEQNPSAFRQRKQNEQLARQRFRYLRESGQLPPEIASSLGNVGIPDQQRQDQTGGADIQKNLQTLIDTLLNLPSRIGVN